MRGRERTRQSRKAGRAERYAIGAAWQCLSCAVTVSVPVKLTHCKRRVTTHGRGRRVARTSRVRTGIERQLRCVDGRFRGHASQQEARSRRLSRRTESAGRRGGAGFETEVTQAISKPAVFALLALGPQGWGRDGSRADASGPLTKTPRRACFFLPVSMRLRPRDVFEGRASIRKSVRTRSER